MNSARFSGKHAYKLNQNTGSSDDTNIKQIKSDEGRKCPLCPGHVDEDDFSWSDLLQAPVCRGCTYEIHNGFIGWKERPTSDQYNHADTIVQIEQLTGHTFQQLKFQYMKALMQERQGTSYEYLNDIRYKELQEPELQAINLKLDSEVLGS